MKKLQFIIVAAILLCSLVAACIFLIKSGGNDKTTINVENAVEIYEDAIAAIPVGDLPLQIKENRTVTNFGISYKAQRDYTIELDHSDPQDQRYHMKDNLTMGTHCIPWEEYRINDKEYVIISGFAFQNTTQRSIALKYEKDTDPAKALDHTLYGKITATQNESGYLFVFSEGRGHESWLNTKPEQIEYIEATAQVSANKQLLSYTYSTAWKEGSSLIEASYEVSIQPMDIAIELPEPKHGWLPLSSYQTGAPMNLELSAGLLVQLSNVSSTYREEIYFEALGDRRIRDICVNLDKTESSTVRFITKTTTTKDSQPDQPEETTKEEIFSGGRYTVSHNGAEEVFDPSISEEAMLKYLQNQLISTIILPKYITDCKVETIDGKIRYSFTGNQEFAESLCRNAGQQLYGDQELLISEAALIETVELICYLELNAKTGLPESSGVHFSGSYKAEGLPYQFLYDVSQTYQIG